MGEERLQRHLAAILAADMVGYSRLMGEDEAGTISRLKAHRAELIDPKITEHNGRIVKTTGDGLLVEFGSAVDAVLCAVAVQRGMAAREAELPAERRIAYRVGINLGEIVIDGDDILGDGVNIAARLEALAEPGGIRISDAVFKNVRGKVDLGFADLGPQKVKNIAEPVPAYKVLLDPSQAGTVVPAKRSAGTLSRWRVGASGALLLLIAGAGITLWQPWITRVEAARLDKMAFPLPKKPSIAVLPFNNLSGDQTQDYLADGLSEEIIAALSSLPDVFVIARHSAFTYKAKAVKVQRVAEELGVRYVLEGSVRRSGGRIRVTAQLIDAVKGHNLWAARYDREMKDLFVVLDEITLKIAKALRVHLTLGEELADWSRGTNNLQAWLLVQRGRTAYYLLTKENNWKARQLLQRAVDLDSHYAQAWDFLAATHALDARFRWSASPSESLKIAMKLAAKSLASNKRRAGPYNVLAFIALVRHRFDEAIDYHQKAVAVEPGDESAKFLFALTLIYAGRPGESVGYMERAMRLNPRYPAYYLLWLGRAYRMAGRNEEAVTTLERTKQRMPGNWLASVELVVIHSEAGRQTAAKAEVAYIRKIKPDATVRGIAQMLLYKDPKERNRVLDALHKAGLPE